MNKVNDKISNRISKEYSKAVKRKFNTAVSNTGMAKFADYSEKQLSQLPKNIIEHSFGCGNPVAFADVKEGQSVLDLGCGAGLDLLLAADKVGASGLVIGVDSNEDMLALATPKTADYKNIELRLGNIENLPVDTDSIDWVISNCVINLSNDKQNIFNEIARVLKPKGKMLVSDIVAENLPWWVRRSGVLRAACAGGVILEENYIAGLKKAGLEHVKILSRQYYDPSQLASIVSDTFPSLIKNFNCCGKLILHSFLTRLAKPIAKNLWSAKISASLTA